MAAPITKLRIGLQPDTPEEHTRLLINVNTEEAQTSLQIATDLRVRANPATAKIYYYNFDGSELLYTETIEPGGNGSWDGEPGRASTAQYEFIFNGWATEPDQVDPTEDATAGVYSSRRVYAAYKQRDISGVLTLKFFNSKNAVLRTSKRSKTWRGKLFWSDDRLNWHEWDGTNINIPDSGSLFFKGEGNSIISGDVTSSTKNNWVIALTSTSGQKPDRVEISGNIMSLLDSETVKEGGIPRMGVECFIQLFRGWRSITKLPDLPAEDLPRDCYRGMFESALADCDPPDVFNAKIFGESCCNLMFSNNPGLTSAPSINAETLGESCLMNMFSGCTGLRTPPVLSCLNLVKRCYYGMFRDCTGLVELAELPATTLAEECYRDMYSGCSGLKISETADSDYTIPFRIPSDGTGATATNALTSMFSGTGGTFTGTPEINKPYYLAAPSGT